ncbi:MAG TPA: LacI family DNA-binding transcriptional regulator [Dermatophilaceae bacterium]|nr:LacI family DNA-binding transcriptional regulator [Dermatophilaceae bacterium]
MRSDKRPRAVTMADVADRAGVSRALVSIVFRGVPGASAATRQRVIRAAEDLAYRPDQRARLLGSNRSRTVGVVFGLHREFHAEVVEALYRSVEATGYDLALGAAAPSRDERRAVRSLLEYRCEALILLGTTLPRAAIEELAERLPVVVVARSLRSRAVDVVRTDDAAGARIAVQHLAALGHERITHVDGRRAPGAAERRRGYRAVMRELGLDRGAALVPGGLTEEDGEHAAAQLLAAKPPTAVFAFNDHCAAGLLTAARSRGVTVPGALSVVGYDDSHIASLSGVALTTVAQDAGTLAGSALELAVRRVEDGPDRQPPAEVVVPPRLVIRRTTAAPAADSSRPRGGRAVRQRR